MTKKYNRKFNTRIIKIYYVYLLVEIAKLYKVHIRTVRAWVKEGLPAIEGLYPHHVKGIDLRHFLNKRQQKRKIKLKNNQFYCTKCKTASIALNNQVRLIYSGKTIGKGIKDFIIQGTCEICGTKLNRFSNENKLDEIEQIFSITEIVGA